MVPVDRAGRSKRKSAPQKARPAPRNDRRSARASDQRQARREQILRAAEGVFADKGFHAASITDVIQAAGVSRGTFYLYFDSKRVIFSELLDSLFFKLAACVRPVDLEPGAPSPLEQLRANVTCALRVVAQNENLMGILFRTGQGIDPEADQKVQDFIESIIDLIRRALQRGQQIGVVRQLDDELVAQCIFGSVKEIVFHGLQSGSFARRALEPMVDEVLRYNLRGFLRI
ncbi:MAG TPA: TetR/AcrR family transcriptional regulator [Candidatus Krumholzibacteria bacterium]|nr:TetR/AcrR family transcriptional regulator [Candidatus Krumholzibacteria bacterium]